MDTTVTCKICGKVEKLRWIKEVNLRLSVSKTCFTCNFWLKKISWENDPVERLSVVRVDGYHHRIGPDDIDNHLMFKGSGGNTYYIRFHNGRVIRTRNLWCQGPIPDRFLAQLPDNAKFIPFDEWSADPTIGGLVAVTEQDLNAVAVLRELHGQPVKYVNEPFVR